MRRIESEREETLSDIKYNEFYRPYEISMDKSWDIFQQEPPNFARLLQQLFGDHARNLHLYLQTDVTEAQAISCLVYLDPPIDKTESDTLFNRGT